MMVSYPMPARTHQIKLKVSTYDIETGAECYGAIQTVEAEVK